MNRIAKKVGFWLSVFVLVSPAELLFLWVISLSLKNELANHAFPPVFLTKWGIAAIAARSNAANSSFGLGRPSAR